MVVNYKDALNIPSNAILPFDPRRYKLAIGSAEYVAIEVIISKIIRMLLKQNNKGWVELATVHAISLSYMGGRADLPNHQVHWIIRSLISCMMGLKGYLPFS